MYLLIDNNNVVVYITTEAVLKSDGIHVGGNQIFSNKSLNIILEENVPSEVIPQKYCYSKSAGFYLNINYKPGSSSNPDIEEKVNYILNKIEPAIDENRLTLDEMKALYVSKSNALCEAKIDAGIDVELSTGVEHFSLTMKDQKNIDKIMDKIKQGMEYAPYHSDSNQCKIYPAIDIIRLSFASDMYLTYYTTYANSINTWIRRSETKEEISKIYFGSQLPDDLQDSLELVMNLTNEEVEKIKIQYGIE